MKSNTNDHFINISCSSCGLAGICLDQSGSGCPDFTPKHTPMSYEERTTIANANYHLRVRDRHQKREFVVVKKRGLVHSPDLCVSEVIK